MVRLALAALSAVTLALAASRPPVDVYLIGDSTMADKVDPDMNPEVGWGMRFARFFTSDVHVHNHAVNGRSTKSFIDQGRWDSVETKLQRGDYVFIEFGHNDEKQDDTSRYADPHGAYKRNIERFVAESRAKGATPILLTPIVRRKFGSNGALEETHGDYPDVVRQVAREQRVPLIDLERETRALVAPLGPEGSKRLYDYVDPGTSIMYPHGHEDDTHLSVVGATEVAALAAEGVRRSGLALGQYVREQPDTTPDPTAQALWNGLPPGAVGDSVVDRPMITPFLVHAAAPATAMVIFPGGGYEHLATDKEGVQIAHWLNSLGISAFVVRYRLGPRYRHPAMLDDAKQAMRMVRRRAADWHVDPHRLGVIGFSAGGHLAATLETQPDSAVRPDFAMLIYPVITMTEPLAHAGSRRSLLGEHPSDSLVLALSAERQVTRTTPPTFIVASTDDKTVPVQNSLMMYDALRAARVPVELHVFGSAPHGFGLATGTSAGLWTTLAASWLQRFVVMSTTPLAPRTP